MAGIALLFGGGKAGAEQWQGVILTSGSIIAYALGEGWADAQRTDHYSNISYYPVWMDKPETKNLLIRLTRRLGDCTAAAPEMERRIQGQDCRKGVLWSGDFNSCANSALSEETFL